jgi:hypothetical protein
MRPRQCQEWTDHEVTTSETRQSRTPGWRMATFLAVPGDAAYGSRCDHDSGSSVERPLPALAVAPHRSLVRHSPLPGGCTQPVRHLASAAPCQAKPCDPAYLCRAAGGGSRASGTGAAGAYLRGSGTYSLHYDVGSGPRGMDRISGRFRESIWSRFTCRYAGGATRRTA